MTTPDRSALIAGLRELADFLEQNDDSAIPEVRISCTATGRTPLAKWAPTPAALSVKPSSNSVHVITTRHFGPIDWPAVKSVAEWNEHVHQVALGTKPDMAVACVSHRFGSSAA